MEVILSVIQPTLRASSSLGIDPLYSPVARYIFANRAWGVEDQLIDFKPVLERINEIRLLAVSQLDEAIKNCENSAQLQDPITSHIFKDLRENLYELESFSADERSKRLSREIFGEQTISFNEWFEKANFNEAVGNQIFTTNEQAFAMVIQGPKPEKMRIDYHINNQQELFYQIEGDMILKTIRNGEIVDVNIKEGMLYLLPSKMPHSPRRPEGTLGQVVEHTRSDEECDGLKWYCKCGNLLHEVDVVMKDIVSQLGDLLRSVRSDTQKMTCKKCNYITT